MKPKRQALGRGLDSLIPMDDVPASGASAINEIDIDLIQPNPDQPRSNFDEEALAELASSIRELGIIQPISLRSVGGYYQIIAGERRFRAARMAGLTTVPAYIRNASDSELTEMALIFKKLIERYELTQERLSERIGKKRATVANFLRLLRLPAEVQLGLRDKRLDMGHARALLSIDDPTMQLKIYKRIIKEGLSVRKVEDLVKSIRENREEDGTDKSKGSLSKDFELLRNHLSSKFNTPVHFSCSASGAGKITFSFKSEDELERLITIFDDVKAHEG